MAPRWIFATALATLLVAAACVGPASATTKPPPPRASPPPPRALPPPPSASPPPPSVSPPPPSALPPPLSASPPPPSALPPSLSASPPPPPPSPTTGGASSAAASATTQGINPYKFTQFVGALKDQFTTLSANFATQLATQTNGLGSSVSDLVFGPAYIAATAKTETIAATQDLLAQLSAATVIPPTYVPGVVVPTQCVGEQVTYTMSGGTCIIASHAGPVTCTPVTVTVLKAPAFCNLGYVSASVITDTQSTTVQTFGGVITNGTVSGGIPTTYIIDKHNTVPTLLPVPSPPPASVPSPPPTPVSVPAPAPQPAYYY